jgi:hypothetical protein
MHTHPASRLAPALILATAVLAAMLLVYVAAYLRLSDYSGDDRIFSTEWQVRLFIPAAKLEARIRRSPVTLCVRTGPRRITTCGAWQFSP